MEFPSVWQDWVFTLGQCVFVVALLPSIASKENKPSPWTSVMTAVILTIFAGTYWSLALSWSAFMAGATALCWYVLLFQKLASR